MMKSSKVASAITIGVVGVLALGACSSGSDQAQVDREAEAASPSPAASGSPTLKVPMPKLNPDFMDVEVTNALPSKCTVNAPDHSNQMTIDCENVALNYVGDQVYIRVPDNKYRISVNRITPGDMQVSQRNWAYVKMNESQDAKTVWNTPYKNKDQQKKAPWGVGMNAWQGKGKFHATVTYLGN